jgi:SPP1 family predicted phage head-tail adaptor
MQAGDLRTQITLLKNYPIKVGGNKKDDWQIKKNPWAKVVYIHGKEVWAAQQVNATKAATVTIRYSSYPTLDETMRVQIGTQVYSIVSINDILNRHEWLEIKIKAAVPGH